MVAEETYLELPSSYVVKKFGKAKPKNILLTFDDGPDPKYTPQILDILKKEKAEAQEKALLVLEEKVKERTEEVVKQKELLEEKQKEILDSIRYAKRIQVALITSEKYIEKTLQKHKGKFN